MSKKEKLEGKILDSTYRTDITFDEAKIFLVSRGFEVKRITGSHVIFEHVDRYGKSVNLVLVNNTKHLKRSYIKEIHKAIEQIEGGDCS